MAARKLTAKRVFSTLYGEWSPDLRDSTRATYLYALERWERLSRNPPLSQLRTSDYTAFRAASAEAGESPYTTEQTLRVIRSVVRCAQANELIDRVPDRGKARKLPKPEPDPPTIEELELMWQSTGCAIWPRLSHVATCEWWRCWIALSVWTGLRLSDLCWGLSWRHVSATRIDYRASKTSVVHVFPISPQIAGVLDRLKAEGATDDTTVLGCSRSPHLIRRELRRIAKRAEIERSITPQHMRQAAVTYWTMADTAAGSIVHGCGMPVVLNHYQDRLAILRSAAGRFPWPRLRAGGKMRQLTLF